jgi:hypothetical protein
MELDRITETTDGEPVDGALLTEGDLGYRQPNASCLPRLRTLGFG